MPIPDWHYSVFQMIPFSFSDDFEPYPLCFHQERIQYKTKWFFHYSDFVGFHVLSSDIFFATFLEPSQLLSLSYFAISSIFVFVSKTMRFQMSLFSDHSTLDSVFKCL